MQRPSMVDEAELDTAMTLPFIGWIRIESRVRWDGHRGISESRAVQYDGDGLQIEDTGWQPTGAVLVLQ